ncbi:MAG: hypothetical protein E7530_00640 [Ruminococcaceae bacterium]|nr:hypothetical protein [Oscillospiraceae bacterium]
MRKKLIIIFLLLVLCLGLFFVITNSENKDVYFTSDVNSYNSELCPVPQNVFPKAIPSNAQVVTFGYFNYWHEAKDIYLEIKFDSKEDMEKYLSEIKTTCELKCNNSNQKKCFFYDENIYNHLYKDLFCMDYVTSEGYKDFTGYRFIKKDTNSMIYKCNFGLISYSFEELIVIHTYVYGWYINDVHKHIPKYFERFDVPLNQEHQRIFLLRENQSGDGSVIEP